MEFVGKPYSSLEQQSSTRKRNQFGNYSVRPIGEDFHRASATEQ
jgi:hypothetical protein